MKENSYIIRREMRKKILGCYWVGISESLYFQGFQRFSFRFESTSASAFGKYIYRIFKKSILYDYIA